MAKKKVSMERSVCVDITYGVTLQYAVAILLMQHVHFKVFLKGRLTLR